MEPKKRTPAINTVHLKRGRRKIKDGNFCLCISLYHFVSLVLILCVPFIRRKTSNKEKHFTHLYPGTLNIFLFWKTILKNTNPQINGKDCPVTKKSFQKKKHLCLHRHIYKHTQSHTLTCPKIQRFVTSDTDALFPHS